MTQGRQLLRSFAGGEITPELYGRLDLSKFQTGLALAENFRTLPHGPATRRPGTRLVNIARNSGSATRIIPFAFSADQTMIIELSAQHIRFHTQGGTLVESPLSATAMTTANPAIFTVPAHGYVTGDWVYAVDMPTYPSLNNQFYIANVLSVNTFTLSRPIGGVVSTIGLPAFSPMKFQRVYSLASPYQEQDIFDIHFAQSADVLTLVHPNYPSLELRRLGALNWTLTQTGFGSGLVPPATVFSAIQQSAAVISPSAASQSNDYAVTAVSYDGVNESYLSAFTSLGNNLNVSGAQNLVTWTAVTGAAYYNVYRRRTGGGYFGFISQTPNLSLVDDNLQPDFTQVAPEQRTTLNTGVGDYPSAVTYGEQRRWFAATDAKPQTVFATRVGNVNNLDSSFPIQANDSLQFTIAAQQQNRVRHLVWLSDLIALTAGGEFRIFSQDAPAITATTLAVKPQGYAGASNVSPVVTTASVLYVQAQGAKIRELSFNGETRSFSTIDMTVMAPHLFEGMTIVDMTFARAPEPTMYAVRSDGVLLGLTYVPEQQVYGWHRFVTDGTVKSVCTVAEGNEDAVYMVVHRLIDGTPFQSIERLTRRYFSQLEDCYFVDNGVSRTYLTPMTVIYGLWHLNGKTVSALGDGADLGDYVVVNGQITLSEAVTTVHVGLPFTSRLQTLPLAVENVAALGQGSPKNISKVHLKVRNTTEFEIGPDFTRMNAPPMRDVTVPYGSPPGLFTGEVSIDVAPSWGVDGAICVRQSRPLPLTILSMVPEVAVGR